MAIFTILWLHQRFSNNGLIFKHVQLVAKYTNIHGLINSFRTSENLTNCQLINFEKDGKQFVDCRLSLKESSNFFCESPLSWNRRKHVYHLQNEMNMKQRQGNGTRGLGSNIFFYSNWHPNFFCAFERRIGDWADGGKWICDINRIARKTSCLVYSMGSNGEFSFETALHQNLPNCEIHTFDKDIFKCPSREICQYHSAFMGSGTDNRSKSLQQVMRELNHTGRELDILKMDIEGGEYGLVQTMVNSLNNVVYPRQILVEVHMINENKEEIHQLMETLRQHHYVMFHKEFNLLGTCCSEFSFLKLEKEFFDRNNLDKNCL